MPLNKSQMQTSVDDLSINSPVSLEDSASKWSSIINEYAFGGMVPPGMIPTFPTEASQDTNLKSKFLKSMENSTFLDDLQLILTEFFQKSIWFSVGFTGVVSVVPPTLVALLAVFKTENLAGLPPSQSLVDIIDNWVKIIQITVTNVTTGATTISNIS